MKDLEPTQYILVAEDAPINMQVIQNQLEAINRRDQCIFTYDGQQALDKAIMVVRTALNESRNVTEIQPIQLCILDFMMPRLNGL